MTDVLRLDATAQLQLLETRRLGALELLELSVERGRAVADTVNAVVAADLEPARAAARYIDERRLAIHRAGGDPAEELGLLGGLPMTVEDAFDVDGLPASRGDPARLERDCADADVVGRVRAAGAVAWGKTNTCAHPDAPHAQSRLYGRTVNPWDLARSAGGGAGGSAAAVAAGVGALEIGSDTAGGLREPAAACGVFALRPTRGLVSCRGYTPPAPGALAEPDLTTAGPVARSARDLRLLLSVLAPAALPARTRPAELIGLRAGLWLEAESFALDPAVRGGVERWAAALAALGAHVEETRPPVPPTPLLRTLDALAGAEAARALSPGAHRRRARLRPAAHALSAAGAGPPGSWAARTLASTASHHAWLQADEARARLGAQMAAAFQQWEVLIAPAACAPAAAHGERRPIACWSALASVLGLPAAVLPAGFVRGGLPVGVQLIGPVGADSRVLAVAEACETEIGGFVAPPLGV